MIGPYTRAALAWGVATVLDTILKVFGDELLAIADCTTSSLPSSVSTNYCTYGQVAVTWFWEAATLGVLVWLIFIGWKESQAGGI